MMLYVIEHTPDGDVFRTYTGLAQDVVAQLLDGRDFDFATEEDYYAQKPADPQPVAL